MSTARRSQTDAVAGSTAESTASVLDTAIQETISQREIVSMRIENETMLAEARARPRSPKAIIAEVRENFEAYPTLAQRCIYNKPVGQEPDKCRDCGQEIKRFQGRTANRCSKCGSNAIQPGGMKFARGLSIRAAEMLAEIYGFNRVKVDLEAIDDFHVRLTGSFTDFQKGRSWTEQATVSRYYKTRDGKSGVTAEDRFHDLVVKAAKSKLVREVILRSLPAGMKVEVEALAEASIAASLTPAAVDKIVSAFAGIGVFLDQLERRIGRTRAFGWTADDRMLLVGIWQAIEDGETTVAQAFEDVRVDPAAATSVGSQATGPASGGATLDDLTSPQGRVETQTSQTPQPRPEPTVAAEPAEDAVQPVGIADVADPFRELRSVLATANSDKVRAIYDQYCGPESALPQGARDRIAKLILDRKAELKEPTTQGSLPLA